MDRELVRRDARPTVPQADLRMVALVVLALKNPIRIRILLILKDGGLDVQSIAARLNMRRPRVSRHLLRLYRSGVLTIRRDGRHHIYTLARLANVAIEPAAANPLQRGGREEATGAMLQIRVAVRSTTVMISTPWITPPQGGQPAVGGPARPANRDHASPPVVTMVPRRDRAGAAADGRNPRMR